MKVILLVSSAERVEFAVADARRFLEFRRERYGESDELVAVEIREDLGTGYPVSVSLSGIWALCWSYLPEDPKPPSPLSEVPKSPSSHSTDS